jgi:HPt (histidine-containing phosphotransfer) domain-containing protein
MDCQMPTMDGLEATKAIRQSHGAARRTPIVALTGSTLRSVHDACLKAGMDAVLTKPLLRSALERVLQSYLTSEPTEPARGSDGPCAPVPKAPLDLDRLREVTLGDANLEYELISTFIADTAKRLSAMAEAIAAGDAGLLAVTAHALKGSAGNLGAHLVQNLARQVEQRARADDFDAAANSLKELDAAVSRTRDFLGRLLDTQS